MKFDPAKMMTNSVMVMFFLMFTFVAYLFYEQYGISLETFGIVVILVISWFALGHSLFDLFKSSRDWNYKQHEFDEWLEKERKK